MILTISPFYLQFVFVFLASTELDLHTVYWHQLEV